ncbi:hypothetical protein P152DRAFT_413039, partial [Eremomyces bilateralis CBS 781.70]
MSEHWKSTPNYWCKFCSVYVRDTPFARRNHEATGRHQSGIQRSLKSLHRTHERDAREKDRAKSEVARLDALVSGGAPSSSKAEGVIGRTERDRERPRQATTEERKRQMAQLAEMGVAVPEEFRGEMAMAGEW